MSVSASLPARSRFDGWRLYFRPRTVTMLMLGFSSGLPFMLTANTLSYWLRDSGISLTAIGFLSWVGLAYSLKPLWAPLVDRLDAPIFGRLGRRRGWMFATQIVICLGLLGMALNGPAADWRPSERARWPLRSRPRPRISWSMLGELRSPRTATSWGCCRRPIRWATAPRSW